LKKVLIISDYFSPDNEIAAIRLTKIGKYLALSGYTVDVLRRGASGRKEDILLKYDLQFFNQIYENVNNGINKYLYYFYHCRNNNISSNILKKMTNIKEIFFIKQIKILLYNFFSILINLNYYHNAINRKDIKIETYNYIISTFGPASNHLIGLNFKKKNKNIIWIADFRDTLRDNIFTFMFRMNKLYLENKIIKYANIITLVSYGCFSLKSSNIYIIPNGFDIDDYQLNNEKHSTNNKFIISYTGSIYSNKSDIRILFKIIKELLEENILNQSDFAVQYLGKNQIDFYNQASVYLRDEFIINSGFVTRNESLKKQKESDMLILASWNDKNEQGIITGKLYEYFVSNRPIICFISGNLPDSKLKEMIIKSNTGCCYEEANSKIDYEIMKNYIKQQYINRKEGKPLNYSPNSSYIDQFNYKNIVNNLVKIMEIK